MRLFRSPECLCGVCVEDLTPQLERTMRAITYNFSAWAQRGRTSGGANRVPSKENCRNSLWRGGEFGTMTKNESPSPPKWRLIGQPAVLPAKVQACSAGTHAIFVRNGGQRR
jgi:hypothetical protein